jgi:hypothetical protein
LQDFGDKKIARQLLKQFFRPPGRVTLGKIQYMRPLRECQARPFDRAI